MSAVQRSQKDFLAGFIDCLEQIQLSVGNYVSGRRFAYKAISVQLRILFCDRTPLYKRLFPNARLHPFAGGIQNLPPSVRKYDKFLSFYLPGGQRQTESGMPIVVGLFNEETPDVVPIEQWLDQQLLSLRITIRELIRSVANKDGGAHVDTNRNETLQKTAEIVLGDLEAHIPYIVSIGDYVCRSLLPYMKALYADKFGSD